MVLYQFIFDCRRQSIEGTTSASEILTLADELTVTGLSLLPTMIQAHPECK